MKNSTKLLIKNLPFCPGVEIINCDSNTTLFALSKPDGVKSHPNKPGIDKNSLLRAPYDLENECYLCQLSDSTSIQVYLLNRLDSPTSGVILLCIDPILALEIRQLFKNQKVQKTYLAIVKDIPRVLHSTWRNRLSSEKREEHIRTQKGGDRVAETKFQLLDHNKSLGISLLKLMPITGLTHQLRVQGALHNHPILGDKTYGNFPFNKEIQKKTSFKRLFLHSSEISLSYNYLKKDRHFIAQSPTPKDFDDLIQFGAVSKKKP